MEKIDKEWNFKYELEKKLLDDGLECYITILDNVYEVCIYESDRKINFFIIRKKLTDTIDSVLKTIHTKYPEYFL